MPGAAILLFSEMIATVSRRYCCSGVILQANRKCIRVNSPSGSDGLFQGGQLFLKGQQNGSIGSDSQALGEIHAMFLDGCSAKSLKYCYGMAPSILVPPQRGDSALPLFHAIYTASHDT
jgi:hypothetical protein